MAKNMTVWCNLVGPGTSQLQHVPLLACLPAPSASSQRVQWVMVGCTDCVSRYQLIRCASQHGHTRLSNDRLFLQPNFHSSHDSSRLMHNASSCAQASSALHADSRKLTHPFLCTCFCRHCRWRRHTAHRVWAKHHRVAAHHWRPPAALTGGVRERI